MSLFVVNLRRTIRSATIVAALALMALPPSSLLPVLLQRTGVQALQFQRICTHVVAANFGYLIVLIGAAAVGTLAA